ncbi:ATP-binding cassette domain-containing protein [Nonomuraea aridisoli]|uniref:Daunorubicin/doxorubicin resistance ABC transporter ATP-binding protein DrrA n=1 Tax=Nonomuraea aridisoli TaxID=2070368 RepID=A0A2W2EM81_9ACTN|nr:ATP-binding cassette domain-containing protein [Nonomuraea aridisoli]PZG23513.1 daunorubicin/doxorubicin resistance ABC transporter ATP-binding protein DrrA [Nonomuraea aridisoli]
MDIRSSDAIVVTEGLRKRFGRTQALAGLDLAVPAGTIFGVLGPNGAGKTTAIRILATLTTVDEGRATVAGYDVVRQSRQVRRHIRLTGQHAALDEDLTGRENLYIFARLLHLRRAEARRRAEELLERFGLADAADRLVRTYSGGMRRRLDLISSMLVPPAVLFLDEPTTGLDPRSRNEIWDTTRELVAQGATVLLTTQYLAEADQLAQHIAVIDGGRVIASGAPKELKARIGGRIDVVVHADHDIDVAQRALAGMARVAPDVDHDQRRLSVPFGSESMSLPEVVRRLDAAGVNPADVAVRLPTLDEVFLTLTDAAAGSDDRNPATRL